MGAREGRIKKI